MNMRRIFALASLFLLTTCIDPIKFDVEGEATRLVIDGFISNVSYTEQCLNPAPAMRFYVALRWTSDVTNVIDQVISDADVSLLTSEGDTYSYSWSIDEQRYLIDDVDFAAQENVDYRVHVELANGEVYESIDDQLYPAPAIEEIDIEHQTILKSIDVNGVAQIVEQRGVQLSVPLGDNETSEPLRYRWKIIPSWVFESSLLPDGNPNKRCYATNIYDYQQINVWEDNSGGYNHDLFFLETDDNEQVQYEYSAYITQYSLSEQAYQFWDQLATQQQSGGGIFDPPPFTLVTNIRNVNDAEEKVSGFFFVAHESSYRWFLYPQDLPYTLVFQDPCEPIPGVPFIPPAGCANCLDYRGASDVTNQKPTWWQEF